MLSFIFTTLEILQQCVFDLLTTRLRETKNPVPSAGYLSTENATVGRLGRQKQNWFPNF